ncbi:MAG: 4-(cytidine 5'-diphospho)-2-C-methyl-D-erythritol kinase, partial [Bifidobacteriaceae bacterium]|nr:4-(cytidine 5'-diphospho)-2-C-methyl-D-erythritol kinase [Bifidobacteriaceae bacterium]
MRQVSAVAPAKINLALRVGRRRADGFHPLNTLFHAVDLVERITVRTAEAGPDQLRVVGPWAGAVPLDGSNLVVRVAERLRGGRSGAIAVVIDKAIPVAGGLAGGSADAAAALVALNELWGLGLSRAELVEVAGELGSDVPFALCGGNAVGEGRGEKLRETAQGGALHWVLLTAREGLATPDV